MYDHKQYLKRLDTDIRLRGLSHNTLKCYTKNVELFLEYTAKQAAGYCRDVQRQQRNALCSTG